MGFEGYIRLLKNGDINYNGSIYHINSESPDSIYCVENVFADPYFYNRFSLDKNGTLRTIMCSVDNSMENYMYHFIVLILSCIFLALTLVVYTCLPELQNTHGKIVIGTVSTMLLAFITMTFLKNGKTDYFKSQCVIIGKSF